MMDDATESNTMRMALGDRLAWVGLIITAMLCLARAMIEHDPFPWWQTDPFVFSPPIIGLTPRWALLLNIALVFASFVSLLGHSMRGRGLSLGVTLLLSGAIALIAAHAMIDQERVLDSSTLAALASVFACASLAYQLPGASRMLGATTIGFALLLTCVGIYEVFVSHPLTLSTYEAGRESFLSARGWSPDSFEALSYERRLRNPEPLAWFGLTNVFASFSAACAAGLLTLSIGVYRTNRWLGLVFGIGSLLCAFGLILTGSKGGYAILLLGLGLMGVLTIGRRRWSGSGVEKWIGGRMLIVLCLGVLVALALRGLLGEQLGERSLLFRWQYLVGSLRIWISDPLMGCGPGLFQERYALLKPALSPEDVASAHSFGLDWLATLGIGGLLLIAYLVRTMLGVRQGDAQDHDEQAPDWGWKVTVLIVVLPLLIALRMQSPVLDLSGLFPILIGGLLWGVSALLIIRCRVPLQLLRNAMFVAGGVLLVHAMIEVTGTLIVSAPLWAMMIGVLRSRPISQQTRAVRWVAPGVLMLLWLALVSRWGAMNSWERSLHSGARDAARIAMVNSTLNALESSSDPQSELGFAQSQLSELLGRPIPASIDEIIPALNQAEVDARLFAIERLKRSLAARPSHIPTRIALSQQMLWIASVAQSSGNDELSTQMWERAVGLFSDRSLNAGGHRWAGNIWSARAQGEPDAPDRTRWLEQARDHWELALGLAPHDPRTAILLMENAIERDDQSQARFWATRAVELHELTRLDPLRGLEPVDLARARRVGSP